MSILSNLTGVHISPKRAYIDPKQLGKAALVAGGTAIGAPLLGSAASSVLDHATGGSTDDGSGGGGGGFWDAAGNFIKNNAGDVLKTGAAVAGGVLSAQQQAAQLAEQKRQYDDNLKQRQAEQATSGEQFGQTLAQRQAEQAASTGQFNRTTGDSEAQAAVRAETQLNKAPIADKAQALILARMGVAPGVFQPRDYTKGQASLVSPKAAPGAAVASAMQKAAAGYVSGQGGVKTDTLQMLLNKMKAGGFSDPNAPTTPPTPRPSLPISDGPPPVKPSTSVPTAPTFPPLPKFAPAATPSSPSMGPTITPGGQPPEVTNHQGQPPSMPGDEPPANADPTDPATQAILKRMGVYTT